MLLTVTVCLCAIALAQSQPNTDASYCIGLTVDGSADDWISCNTPRLTMSMVQIGGSAGSARLDQALTIRFAHDTTNIYVLAKIEAPYYFNLTAGNGFAHSVAVMWQVGPKATMLDMGGCPLPASVSDPTDCAQVQAACSGDMCSNCSDYMTDVWHMETGSPGAIPGVTYPWRQPHVVPSNPTLGYDPEGIGRFQPSVRRLFGGDDPTSNSDDEFSLHPCLRGDDGSSSSHLGAFRYEQTVYQNQLRYAWSHTAIDSTEYPFGTVGANGSYVYEFSRPLRTTENTDAQFTVGETAGYAFALWIPPALGEEWADDGHYVAPGSFQFGQVSLTSAATDTDPADDDGDGENGDGENGDGENGDDESEDGASSSAVNILLIGVSTLLCCLMLVFM